MSGLMDLLKRYYSRECRMNRVYCSILYEICSKEKANEKVNHGCRDHDDLLITVMNYLILDTYKNVTVLWDMLFRLGNRGVYTEMDGGGNSNNMNNCYKDSDVFGLLNTLLNMEKGLSQNMANDHCTCCYADDDSSNHAHSLQNYLSHPAEHDDVMIRRCIRSLLHCISADIEERLSILSSLTRAVHATRFCECGYELPRIAGVDVHQQQQGITSNSRNSLTIVLTIHCPRCGRAYHSLVEDNTSSAKEPSRDIRCYL